MVERVARIEGRGYVVSVRGAEKGGPEVEVFVSEKGRRVTARLKNGAQVRT